MRLSAATHRSMRRRRGSGGCGPPRLRAQCDRAGHLPWQRQPRARRRIAGCRRPRPWRRTRQPRSATASSRPCTRPVRGVHFSFVRRLTEAPAPATLRTVAERIRALGWHLVVYFEPEELPALYRLLAGCRCRSDDHGPAGGDPAGRWSRVRAVPAAAARTPHLVQGRLPERLSRAARRIMRTSSFARRIVESFPDRVL